MTAPAVDGSPQYTQAWPTRARHVLAALPTGTMEAARDSLQRGLRLFGAVRGQRSWLTDASLARRLVAPLLVVDDWPLPSAPLPVGDGAVHADLIDEDHEVFAHLRSGLAALEPALDAEQLAAAAQQIRLPVTPYRALGHPETNSTPDDPPTDTNLDHPAELRSTPLVLDLSALWAGPLTTSLLAELGARVIKIDPDCRPDALRQHALFYQTLNANKTVIDLDLRSEPDRKHFESLLADADLVVDSFSRRVMPNFGYGPDDLHDRYPQLSTLSIVAFGARSPERDWVSYGPGVHAISGLSRGKPAPIAYPDALAGLSAFAAAAELLSGATNRRHVEISLSSALQPLVAGAILARAGP